MKEMFDKRTIEMASTKPLKHKLKGCLEDLERKQLDKMATSYGVKSLEYKHVIRVAQEVTKYIRETNYVHDTFVKLLSYDKSKFGAIYDLIANDYVDATKTEEELYQKLNEVGFAFYYCENDNLKIVVPDEIKTDLVGLNKIEDESRKELILKYLKSFKNIYGVFDVEYFMQVFNEQNKSLDKLNLCEFMSLLKSYNADEKMINVYKQYIIADELANDLEKAEKFIESIKVRKYYKPSKDTIMKYEDPLYFHKTMAHINLKNFIDSISSDPKLSLEVISIMCLGSSSDIISAEEFYKTLVSRGVVFKKKSELQTLVDLYNEVEKNTRKWKTRGWTSLELQVKK